jgi:hypothetical protein
MRNSNFFIEVILYRMSFSYFDGHTNMFQWACFVYKVNNLKEFKFNFNLIEQLLNPITRKYCNLISKLVYLFKNINGQK